MYRRQLPAALGVLLLSALCASTGAAVLRADRSRHAVDRWTREALALRPDSRRGARTFARHCARCHGPTAAGDPARVIPALAGQRFRYLLRELADFSGGQRDSATMHRVVSRQVLRKPQTWADIAAFLHSEPVAAHPQTGSGAHVALGRGIFHEQCSSCHGTDARGGDAGLAPSLRDQNYGYLVVQMDRIAAGSRHNIDGNLARFMRSFDDTDIDGVADYLSRLPVSGRRRR